MLIVRPDKEAAPVIAARLAKYGVNMLRLHSMDGRSGPLIDYRDGTSQQFDRGGLGPRSTSSCPS